MDAKGKRFAIVVSRWNEFITKQLLEGAIDEFARHGDPDIEVVWVPGTWEIPPTIASLLTCKTKVDGIVALGCILQGATVHAQLLANDVGAAIMNLQIEHKTPISWGILTPESQDQALERAGMKLGNKGREAALAAIEMSSVLGQI